eukprot:1201566-Rhodomonas_salina.1
MSGASLFAIRASISSRCTPHSCARYADVCTFLRRPVTVGGEKGRMRVSVCVCVGRAGGAGEGGREWKGARERGRERGGERGREQGREEEREGEREQYRGPSLSACTLSPRFSPTSGVAPYPILVPRLA